jgi:hypothetical protein
MFSKKPPPPPVGAREKIAHAQALAKKKGFYHIESKREGKPPDVTISVIIIYGMAVVLALLLTQGMLDKGDAPFRLSDPYLHELLLGRHPPAFMGDRDMDTLIAVFIRGTVIFLLAGVMPLLSRLWDRMRGNNKPDFFIFWVVSTAVIGLVTVCVTLF